MRRFFALAAVLGMSMVVPTLLMAQSDPLVGTWKMNPAKSKFSPASTAPKSDTLTIQAQGAGVKISADGVNADGSRIATSYTTNFDGKESAITGPGFPNGADSIAVKRVNANTTTGTGKRAGKVVYTRSMVVSKDGKVLTITAKGTDPQGQPTSSTTVWDKQ